MRNLIVCMLLSFCCTLAAQESDNRFKFNAGIKAGFQAIAYNDPEFEIDGYSYNENTIHSNKIGYTIAPFFRLSYGRLYIQTDAAFGITHRNFDFTDKHKNSIEEITPNIPQYDIRTYCMQVPLLIGYEYIKKAKYGMSVFTGPRTKFTFTSLDKQQFKHFVYNDLEEVLKKKSYYWEIGFGVRIHNVFFDFVYDLGLTDTSRYIISPNSDKKFKSGYKENILSFSVGMIF